MKLASMKNGSSDGRLYIVSRNHDKAVAARAATTMQEALDNWESCANSLAEQYADLNSDGERDAIIFNPGTALAPLPRAWQWLDGSTFNNHSELMQRAFKLAPVDTGGRPLMYQGLSNKFYAATDDVVFPSFDDGIDFEGEFGVITSQVPLGTKATDAARYIRLIVQINDWSLRKIAPIEMKTGFGWVQAKPASSMAPVAVTPDELGSAWRDSRADLRLNVYWNEEKFGAANGYDMAFGFDDLVAHAAYSRELVAGTVIGSGTVSNANYRDVGSSCIAERRGIEMLEQGEPSTPFMSFGDRVRMDASLVDGTPLFGRIDQKVVQAR